MKALVFMVFLVFSWMPGIAQNTYFPPTSGAQWATVSPASLNWNSQEIPALNQFLEDNHTKAFIVLHNGKIAIESYFGSFTQDSLWYWASAGKTITAFSVGLAQEDGFLNINAPTSDYLGSGWTHCTPQQENAITVAHQLTMTTGLDDGVADLFCTDDTCLQYLTNPETRWSYHNGPYTLLTDVVSNAVGQPINVYNNQRFLNAIGINGGFYPFGYNRLFLSNARSMARFGLLISNDGNWNGNPIMSDQTYFQSMITTSQPLNKAYGYLWWLNGKDSYLLPQSQFLFSGSLIPNAPDDMIAAIGKNGQLINIVPSKNLVVIRMGEAPDGPGGLVSTLFNNNLWENLCRVLCSSVGTQNYSTEPNLQIYPQPSRDLLNIRTSEQLSSVEIMNLSGQQVILSQTVLSPVNLNVKHLPSGTYIARLTYTNGNVAHRKISIQ